MYRSINLTLYQRFRRLSSSTPSSSCPHHITHVSLRAVPSSFFLLRSLQLSQALLCSHSCSSCSLTNSPSNAFVRLPSAVIPHQPLPGNHHDIPAIAAPIWSKPFSVRISAYKISASSLTGAQTGCPHRAHHITPAPCSCPFEAVSLDLAGIESRNVQR